MQEDKYLGHKLVAAGHRVHHVLQICNWMLQYRIETFWFYCTSTELSTPVLYVNSSFPVYSTGTVQLYRSVPVLYQVRKQDGCTVQLYLVDGQTLLLSFCFFVFQMIMAVTYFLAPKAQFCILVVRLGRGSLCEDGLCVVC